MSQIILGKAGSKNIVLDLDALLRGRMLIQANSGKGKSWLLRRLAEQLFGKVQIIIIDPEGEFATLREKFGFVLVGKGGETPADARSAALVAHKLLELKASAVCDLYEMKPAARHEWVQKFIDAMIDAPKNLWHPVVFMVDEAHIYCPEKGAGESVASESIISLATRGRKRGFSLIAATQRLGKLRKDAAAELLNVMIGGTFIDIDRKRAADALGVYGAEQHKFFDEIKILVRGSFFALGPAISDERVLVKIGEVETSHPEAGSARHAAEPPPAPEKIQALLPKLADLPKAADDKVRTEADLRSEIRFLKTQLNAQPKVETVIQADDLRKLRQEHAKAVVVLVTDGKTLRANGLRTAKALMQLAESTAKQFGSESPKFEDSPVHRSSTLPTTPGKSFTRFTPSPESNDDGSLTNPQKKILRALAEFEAIGVHEPSRSMVASWCEVKANTGSFKNYLSALRTRGLILDKHGDKLAITDEGRSNAPKIEAPATTEELLFRSVGIFGATPAKILRVVHEAYPKHVTRDSIAEQLGILAETGSFKNYISELRTAAMIEDGPDRTLKAADWLFLD